MLSVVFTNAAPSGIASYRPWSCFLFREAARVLRASWRRALFLARGCSKLADGSFMIRGTSPLSCLASYSLRSLVALTSLSLSKSSSYHFSWLISSSSPMMLSSVDVGDSCCVSWIPRGLNMSLPMIARCLFGTTMMSARPAFHPFHSMSQ